MRGRELRELLTKPGYSLPSSSAAYPDASLQIRHSSGGSALEGGQLSFQHHWPQVVLMSRRMGWALRPATLLAGLSWEECKQRCPAGVVPACHNSEDTVTISGPQVGLQS